MTLLEEGTKIGAIFKTNLSRKLTIGGHTETYPVYKVQLNLLFYNDQNDRIATWINEYKSNHEGSSVDLSDKESYNNIIQDFIVKSNLEAIKKTQANIAAFDQREPGVILADGRIIDGNRRFACLRRLSKDSDKFNYFETVILDKSFQNNAKQIKMLELSIQHGEESKTDYGAIDRLVGVYNDIIKNKLLSVAEYSRSSNEPEKDVNKRVEIAELMVEFLEFIHAPLEFHISRDMQIYAPIESLPQLLKKCRTADEAEDVKISVFTNLLMRTEGDMRQFVRNLKNIIGTEYQQGFIAEQMEIADEVVDSLPANQVTISVIRDSIRTNDEVVQQLENSLEKALVKVKKTETRNLPVNNIEKATVLLENIDLNIIKKLNDSDIQRIERQLRILENTVEEIRGKLNG